MAVVAETERPAGLIAARPETRAQFVRVADRGPHSISWGAVLAGAVVALATMVLLGFLGAGIGFAVVDPQYDESPLSGMTTGTIIYLGFAQLASMFVGGYVAAALSSSISMRSAVLHGVTVWGLATLASVYMAVTASVSLVQTSFSALSSAASAAGTAVTGVIPNDIEFPSVSVPNVEMRDLPTEIQGAIQEQRGEIEQLRAEARAAVREVVSRQQQEQAREVAVTTAANLIRDPREAEQIIERGVDRLIGDDGVFTERDRQELMTVMRTRFGITEVDAREMLDQWQARLEAANQRFNESVASAREDSIELAQIATDRLATASFYAFAALLLGLLIAAAGGGVGRRDVPQAEIA